jgi:hypothetical protein
MALERDRPSESPSSLTKAESPLALEDYTDLKQSLGPTKTGLLYRDNKTGKAYVLKNKKVRPFAYGWRSGFYRRNLTKAEIAYEKLAFNLYELCGVRVPESRIIAGKSETKGNDGAKTMWIGGVDPLRSVPVYESKELIHSMPLYDACEKKEESCHYIASEKLEGFQSFQEIFGLEKFDSSEMARLNQAFSEQKYNGKPIRGLFENIAIYAFLFDWDALGHALNNIGLIDCGEYYQVIKIDPGEVCLSSRPDGQPIEKNGFMDLSSSTVLTEFSMAKSDDWNFQKVFRHASLSQKLDGICRVVNLTEEAIRQAINAANDLSQEVKDAFVDELLRRRELFLKQYYFDIKANAPHRLPSRPSAVIAAITSPVLSYKAFTTLRKSPALMELDYKDNIRKNAETMMKEEFLFDDFEWSPNTVGVENNKCFRLYTLSIEVPDLNIKSQEVREIAMNKLKKDLAVLRYAAHFNLFNECKSEINTWIKSTIENIPIDDLLNLDEEGHIGNNGQAVIRELCSFSLLENPEIYLALCNKLSCLSWNSETSLLYNIEINIDRLKNTLNDLKEKITPKREFTFAESSLLSKKMSSELLEYKTRRSPSQVIEFLDKVAIPFNIPLQKEINETLTTDYKNNTLSEYDVDPLRKYGFLSQHDLTSVTGPTAYLQEIKIKEVTYHSWEKSLLQYTSKLLLVSQYLPDQKFSPLQRAQIGERVGQELLEKSDNVVSNFIDLATAILLFHDNKTIENFGISLPGQVLEGLNHDFSQLPSWGKEYGPIPTLIPRLLERGFLRQPAGEAVVSMAVISKESHSAPGPSIPSAGEKTSTDVSVSQILRQETPHGIADQLQNGSKENKLADANSTTAAMPSAAITPDATPVVVAQAVAAPLSETNTLAAKQPEISAQKENKLAGANSTTAAMLSAAITSDAAPVVVAQAVAAPLSETNTLAAKQPEISAQQIFNLLKNIFLNTQYWHTKITLSSYSTAEEAGKNITVPKGISEGITLIKHIEHQRAPDYQKAIQQLAKIGHDRIANGWGSWLFRLRYDETTSLYKTLRDEIHSKEDKNRSNINFTRLQETLSKFEEKMKSKDAHTSQALKKPDFKN